MKNRLISLLLCTSALINLPAFADSHSKGTEAPATAQVLLENPTGEQLYLGALTFATPNVGNVSVALTSPIGFNGAQSLPINHSSTEQYSTAELTIYNQAGLSNLRYFYHDNESSSAIDLSKDIPITVKILSYDANTKIYKAEIWQDPSKVQVLNLSYQCGTVGCK